MSTFMPQRLRSQDKILKLIAEQLNFLDLRNPNALCFL